MFGHNPLPEPDPNEPNEPIETFFGWLKKHTLSIISQFAGILGLLGLAVSSVYYVTHGEYFEYLNPERIQDGVFWLHIFVLTLFIGWSFWTIDSEVEVEKGRKTFRRVFTRDLWAHEIEHSENQLKKFKWWFLIFWIAMGCLYVAFIAQRYLPPSYEETAEKEPFTMFSKDGENEKASKDEKNIKYSLEDIEKKVKEFDAAAENSDEFQRKLKEHEIYLQIKALKDARLKDKVDKIIIQLKAPEIDRALKHIDETAGQATPSQTISPKPQSAQTQSSSINISLKNEGNLKYKEIYDKVWAAHVTQDEENRKQYIEQAKEDIEPLMYNNALNEQERNIFTQIKNLETKELEKNFDKIIEAINELKESESISRNDKHNKVLTKIIFASIIYIFNNLGWWIIFVCFVVTTTQNKEAVKRENKLLYLFFVGFVILCVIFPFIIFSRYFNGASSLQLTQWIVFFDGLSGILNAVVLALLIARLDSKLIGLSSILIGVLYFYAAFQPLFVVFEQPEEIPQFIKTVVLVAVFISKIYFFLIITYAIQSGRILTYLYCYPTLSNRVNSIFANPFRIEGEEVADAFKFNILRNNETVYSGIYKTSDVEVVNEKIKELKENVKLERDNKEEKYIKVMPTTKDQYAVKIYDKNEEVIFESRDESMTFDEANKLRAESMKHIPHCEPHTINKKYN